MKIFADIFRLLLVLMLILGFGGTAYSDITGSQVDVGMQIRYSDDYIGPLDIPWKWGNLDASGTGSNPLSAGVILTGPVTGMQVSSILNLSSLLSESATLQFSIALDGNNYQREWGYMGVINIVTSNIFSSLDNKADIIYNASAQTPLTVVWNFRYAGINPNGLNQVGVLDNNVQILTLGNLGDVGEYSGQQSFILNSGLHTITVGFVPNITGDIWMIEGNLIGDISLEFGSQPVPEPSTMLLLGSGLLGLAGYGRKKFFKK
jgi:hypothetical protein